MTAEERDPESYAVIGAAMAVHRAPGYGFLKAVYQEALAMELNLLGIPHVREPALPIFYRGEALGASYRADSICFNAVIIEVKALARLTQVEHAQVINDLKAARLNRALLLNFARRVWSTKGSSSRRLICRIRSDPQKGFRTLTTDPPSEADRARRWGARFQRRERAKKERFIRRLRRFTQIRIFLKLRKSA